MSDSFADNPSNLPVSMPGNYSNTNDSFVDCSSKRDKLLKILVEKHDLSAEELSSLLTEMDNFDVVAKVFLLEGVPYVFSSSPMKYLIFREQVANKFGIGYQDVCIVGSAKLGFSPSPKKFGRKFQENSDVDVVIISDKMFNVGTKELFKCLNSHKISGIHSGTDDNVSVERRSIRVIMESIRNFSYENFNPSLLPEDNALKNDIFSNISSTSALFLALEPQVFVSKIRCRIFKNWMAAESYYTNTLRQLKKSLLSGGYTSDSGAALADFEEMIGVDE